MCVLNSTNLAVLSFSIEAEFNQNSKGNVHPNSLILGAKKDRDLTAFIVKRYGESRGIYNKTSLNIFLW